METHKEGITLITPTGDRHRAFEICIKYMLRQTKLPNQWIVADDGKQHLEFKTFLQWNDFLHGVEINHIKRKPIPKRSNGSSTKPKSFTGNILACIEAVKYNHVMVIEDDDWYHPTYIEKMMVRLQHADLVGESRAKYYNVETKQFRQQGNTNRASFCQTAFKSNILPILKLCCENKRGSAFVDSRLWQKTSINKRLFEDQFYCVGIKGLPGRKGIGIGHRPPTSYSRDPNWSQLIKWIGLEDTQVYIDLYKELNN